MNREFTDQTNVAETPNNPETETSISPTVQAALDTLPQKHKKLFEGLFATGALPNLIDTMNGQNPDFSDWGEGARKALEFLRTWSPEALGITLFLCYAVWGARLIEEKFSGSLMLLPMRLFLHGIGVGGSYATYYFIENPQMIGPTITNLSAKIQPFLEFMVNLLHQIENLG